MNMFHVYNLKQDNMKIVKGLACNSTFKTNSSQLLFLITFGGCTSSMSGSAQRSIFLPKILLRPT